MTKFVREALAAATLPLGVLFMLAFSVACSVGYFLGEKIGNDFAVYFRTANSPVEAAYQWAGLYVFPYAPTMLLWISPLSLFSFWPAFILFNLISIALFVWAVRPYLPNIAILLCLVSPAIFSGLMTGQVSLLVTSLLVLACGAEDRVKAGILLGIIASIKPHFVLMAPLVLVLLRDWRALWSAAATFLAIIFLSSTLFGLDRWAEWLHALERLKAAVTGTDISMRGITPAIFAERMGLPSKLAMPIGILFGVAIAYFGRKAEPIERAALIGASSLLAAPYALHYDLAIVMPFVTLALSQRRFFALLATVPWFSLPLIFVSMDLVRQKSRS